MLGMRAVDVLAKSSAINLGIPRQWVMRGWTLLRQKIKYVGDIAAQLPLDRMLILLIMIRVESVPLVAENFFPSQIFERACKSSLCMQDRTFHLEEQRDSEKIFCGVCFCVMLKSCFLWRSVKDQ